MTNNFSSWWLEIILMTSKIFTSHWPEFWVASNHETHKCITSSGSPSKLWFQRLVKRVHRMAIKLEPSLNYNGSNQIKMLLLESMTAIRFSISWTLFLLNSIICPYLPKLTTVNDDFAWSKFYQTKECLPNHNSNEIHNHFDPAIVRRNKQKVTDFQWARI